MLPYFTVESKHKPIYWPELNQLWDDSNMQQAGSLSCKLAYDLYQH